MNIKKKEIKCPTCGEKGTWKSSNESRPFCSPRCKLIDLGEWADEQHRIAGEPVADEDPSENETDTQGNKQ